MAELDSKFACSVRRSVVNDDPGGRFGGLGNEAAAQRRMLSASSRPE